VTDFSSTVNLVALSKLGTAVMLATFSLLPAASFMTWWELQAQRINQFQTTGPY
jgi:uncharacterized membrane protein